MTRLATTGSTRMKLAGLALAAGFGLTTTAAQAEDLKIGMMVTLSGAPAVLGQQARDGFQLALDELDGRIGGLDTELIVVDDELKPDVARTKVEGLLQRDEVDFVVGTIFSNVLQAIFKPVTDSETFLISPNAGPSSFAGAECSPYFFVTSYQNDQVHEVQGAHAQQEGFERVFLMAPNYQAGKDSINGFKRHFEGEIVDEVYTQLGQLDFSAEIARIAAAQPDALFIFMPGGMGVNFVRQFRQAGLADSVTFLSAFTVDESTLPAQKDDAVGFFGAAQWAPNLDNPQNAAFVEAFEAKYDYVPGTYAFQGYDTAMLIDSAVRAVGGDLSDKEALRAALQAADFTSLRGDFAFNNNGYPIQDFYLLQVAKREDGKFQTEIVEKIFDDYGDVYAENCPL